MTTTLLSYTTGYTIIIYNYIIKVIMYTAGYEKENDSKVLRNLTLQ